MESLESRIAQLETRLQSQNRMFKALFAVSLACLAFPFAWAGIGQGDQIQGVVRARGFEVVNSAGTTVALIRQDSGQGGAIRLLNKNGGHGISLFASEQAISARRFSVLDGTEVRAILTSEPTGGSLTLNAPAYKMAAKLSVSGQQLSGTPPRTGAPVANPLTGPAGGRLELRSLVDNKVIFKAP